MTRRPAFPAIGQRLSLHHRTRSGPPFRDPLAGAGRVDARIDRVLGAIDIHTHVGFSTLRMEPCWMAPGQAAGVAAALSVREGVPPRKLHVGKIQRELLRQNAMLIYFNSSTMALPIASPIW